MNTSKLKDKNATRYKNEASITEVRTMIRKRQDRLGNKETALKWIYVSCEAGVNTADERPSGT